MLAAAAAAGTSHRRQRQPRALAISQHPLQNAQRLVHSWRCAVLRL